MPLPTTGVDAGFGFFVVLGFGVAARVLPREARSVVLAGAGEAEVADGDGVTGTAVAGELLGDALGDRLGTTSTVSAAVDEAGLLARWMPPTVPPTASATPSATLAVRPTGDLNIRTRGRFSVTDLSFPLTT